MNTFGIDFEDIKSKGFNSKNFPIKNTVVDNGKSGRLRKILELVFLSEDEERVRKILQEGSKAYQRKKNRSKKLLDIVELFREKLDKEKVPYSFSKARSGTMYIQIEFGEHEEFRFSDHPQGNDHYNWILGEDIIYDSTDVHLKNYKKILNGIVKNFEQEKCST